MLFAIRLSTWPLPGQTIPLTYVEIDAGMAGDCKMVGDINGDGLPDLVIGGMPGEKLNWYRAPNWSKTVIATPATEFTTDGALGDVDGDGDLDIIVPDGNGANNLLWFRNPRPGGDPANGGLWERKVIGTVGGWGKDVKPADFDGDGRLDIATRSGSQAMIFFQTAANVWLQAILAVSSLGEEGLGRGDLDQDGDEDLIVCGAWLRNPGGTAAHTPANWNEYAIGGADSSFKAVMTDLNGDTTRDVVFSSSEGTADVKWWRPATGDPAGSWIGSTILTAMSGVHTLQAADMDLDGDNDLVLGQMHTTVAKKILILLNANGLGTSWQTQEVAATGLHNGVVADIESDGDPDIYGSNWTGNPPLRLWLNGLDSGAPSLEVVAPTSAAIWEKGKTYAVTWLKQGAQNAYVKILLYKGTSTLVQTLTSKTDNDGSFSWTVPAALAIGNAYFVRIKTFDNLIFDDSDRFQVIVPALTIIAPGARTVWLKNTTRAIAWNKLGTQHASVKIQLYKGTTRKLNISLSAPNSGIFDWLIPSTLASAAYSIQIATLDGKVKGKSALFSIATGRIAITQPTTGAVWQRGSPHIVTWTSEGTVNANVKIQLFKGTALVSTLATATPNDGSYEWTIPGNLALAANYKLRIIAADNQVRADSGRFTIAAGIGLTLKAPDKITP